MTSFAERTHKPQTRKPSTAPPGALSADTAGHRANRELRTPALIGPTATSAEWEAARGLEGRPSNALPRLGSAAKEVAARAPSARASILPSSMQAYFGPRFGRSFGNRMQRGDRIGANVPDNGASGSTLSRAGAFPSAIQPKLAVGLVDDPLEHEADRVADQVMRMPARVAAPQVNRKCAACEEEEKLQKKETGPQATFREAPASVHEVLRAPGQPLDAATRAYFEPLFGQDFSGVRVHTGTSAAQSAREVNAHAYTLGQNMVFDAGRFAPRTHEGQRLIAHELTHVVQQSGSDGIRAGLGNEKRDLSPLSLQKQVTAGPFLVARTPGDGEPSPPVVSLPSKSENLARLGDLMAAWVPSPEKQRLTTISRAGAIELKTGRRVYLVAIAGRVQPCH
jgi:hypothetical protein